MSVQGESVRRETRDERQEARQGKSRSRGMARPSPMGHKREPVNEREENTHKHYVLRSEKTHLGLDRHINHNDCQVQSLHGDTYTLCRERDSR